MFGYMTFNVKYSILSQIFYKKNRVRVYFKRVKGLWIFSPMGSFSISTNFVKTLANLFLVLWSLETRSNGDVSFPNIREMHLLFEQSTLLKFVLLLWNNLLKQSVLYPTLTSVRFSSSVTVLVFVESFSRDKITESYQVEWKI